MQKCVGAGEREGATAPFPRLQASYFRFACFIFHDVPTILEPGTVYNVADRLF